MSTKKPRSQSHQIIKSSYGFCNLKNCKSFKRIKHILDEYHMKQWTNNDNDIILQYLDKYDKLINDYHHILIKHLSHSNHTTNIENIHYIHSQITFECDINQCQQYKHHHANKLDANNNNNNNNANNHKLTLFLDFLSSIHVYFVHSFDGGFRSYTTPNIVDSDPLNHSFDQDMINQLLLFQFGDRDNIITALRMATNKNDINEIIDIVKNIENEKQKKLISQLSSSEFYEDEQIISIKNNMKNKRKLLLSIRGDKRMKNNKFCTKIKTSLKTSMMSYLRRTESKRNKLLLNPDILKRDESDKYNIDENDENNTFKVLMNKNLIQNGIDEHILDELNEWMVANNYDTDAIIDDIHIARNKGDDQSNIHHYCLLKNQIKFFNKIKQFVIKNGPRLNPTPRDRFGSGSEEKRANHEIEFVDGIKMENEEEIEVKLNNVKRGNKEYVFGQRYYYWPSKKNDAWYIPQKYTDLKEEILNKMDINIYDYCYYKAMELLKESDVLKKKLSNNDGKILGIDKNMDEALNIDNILSIIFYTDYDVLANEFKSTFFKLSADESDISQKMRHCEYWNWSKILTETIECYGTPFRFNKIDVLYHNTTFMYYGLFTATFNAPTSMSRYIEVAAMYCDEDGVILEMSQYAKIRPKYFNCSVISSYGYEHELLFIGCDKPMDIESIRVIKYNEDHKCFIKAMRLFNKVTTATILSILERCEVTESDYIIIQRLIKNNNNFPKYMNESFRQFCCDKKRIKMDTYCLRDKRYYNNYGALFMHKYHENLLRFDYICKLFPNVMTIESWDTGEIKSLYLIALKNMLIAINRMGQKSKLKRIIIHCDPLDQKLNLNKQRFKEQNWIIRKTEQWELVLFKRNQKKL